jgi:hypothetical protein
VFSFCWSSFDRGGLENPAGAQDRVQRGADVLYSAGVGGAAGSVMLDRRGALPFERVEAAGHGAVQRGPEGGVDDAGRRPVQHEQLEDQHRPGNRGVGHPVDDAPRRGTDRVELLLGEGDVGVVHAGCEYGAHRRRQRAERASRRVQVSRVSTPFAGAIPLVVWKLRTAACVSAPYCPSSTSGCADARTRLSLRALRLLDLFAVRPDLQNAVRRGDRAVLESEHRMARRRLEVFGIGGRLRLRLTAPRDRASANVSHCDRRSRVTFGRSELRSFGRSNFGSSSPSSFGSSSPSSFGSSAPPVLVP